MEMTDPKREGLTEQVRAMQIIVFALAMGVLTFALMLVLVIQPEPTQEDVLLAYVAAAAAAICIPVGFVVPRVIASQQPATLAMYQTKLIVGAAIFEGAAFFNLVTYMIEGQVFSLAIAGVLLLLILMHFPTVGGVQEWLETRTQRARDAEALDSPRS
jgi:hypothetical protein